MEILEAINKSNRLLNICQQSNFISTNMQEKPQAKKAHVTLKPLQQK